MSARFPEPTRGEKGDFEQGYEDGKYGRPCRPRSFEYLEGYERGREVARLIDTNRPAPSPTRAQQA